MALDKAPLGKSSEYPDQYSPQLLFAVPRDDNRRRIALADGCWPWFGEDLWQAWEISWLQPNGVPVVAWGVIRVPAASASLIESKSLKLYLNSLNQTVFASAEPVRELIVQDLSGLCGAPVSVVLHSVDDAVMAVGRPPGYQLIDGEHVDSIGYEYRPQVLSAPGPRVTEKLCSHLLKSNCPVTGQPDWGTLLIEYTGAQLSKPNLLEYVVGFRQKQDFHEHCVETVFTDILARCQPEQLTVCARYTRRGGLDINPWRSTQPGSAPHVRLVRQ